MPLLRLLVAWVVLSTDIKITDDFGKMFWNDVRKLAIAAELRDPAESIEVTSVVDTIQNIRKVRDCLLLAPPASDIVLFSYIHPASIAAARLDNVKLAGYYVLLYQLYPGQASISIARADTKALYNARDALDDARRYGVVERRLALQRLRDLIGEEAFKKGIMPPPVPLWHFSYLR